MLVLENELREPATLVVDGVLMSTADLMARSAELAQQFHSMIAGADDGVRWSFIPATLPTRDDPLAERGYLVFKFVHQGRQYGECTVFGRSDQERPDFVADALAVHRDRIAHLRALLDQHPAVHVDTDTLH